MTLGNTYYLRNKKYDKRLKEKGPCGLIWKYRNYNGDYEDDIHRHHLCSRFKGHRGNHKCNCGSSTKLEYNANASNHRTKIRRENLSDGEEK